jgi:hypothetical protein
MGRAKWSAKHDIIMPVANIRGLRARLLRAVIRAEAMIVEPS